MTHLTRLGGTRRKSDIVLVVLLGGICCVLAALPTGFDREGSASKHVRARAEEVDNTDLMRSQIILSGSQQIRARVLEGPFEGQVVTAGNFLQGRMEMDDLISPGDEFLMEYFERDGKIVRAVSRGHYRVGIEWLLAGLFAVLLILVAGWTGLKAILSFLFAGLMFWKVLIPGMLKYWDPIWLTLGVVGALTAAVSFLVGGFTRKGMATFLGAILGLVLTCILAQMFVGPFHLQGATRAFSENLLYAGFSGLNLTKVFVAGVFLAASGAVMDLAMDIAAAMEEIKAKHPAIGGWEHFRSGLRVGRAVIGTMTTTLLLAYSGTSLGMIMLFMSQGRPLVTVFNMKLVAAEVLNTFVGSFGLVTVAPFTALVGAVLFRIGPRPVARGRQQDSSN